MPQTSTRSADEVVGAVVRWLGDQVGQAPELMACDRPEGTGLSSETLLLDLRWSGGEAVRSGPYVLRLPPPPDAFPLFPHYDLGRQVAAMRVVGERSQVPVPHVAWFEPSGEVLGTPFLLMARIDGRTASDVPPYVFGGWVVEATPGERAAMTEAMAGVLAGIHAIQPPVELELDAAGATPLRRHVAHQRAYYEWIRGDGRHPLVERTFRWLDDRWPEDEGPAVLSWGDARLANVLWAGTHPAAVLDWEAVAPGPRELDLGWLLYFADYFQRVAEGHGYPGVPDLLRRDHVIGAYEQLAGCAVRHLDWHLVYAALRQALTSIRVSSRAVHFGERPAPDDPADLILDRQHLTEAIDT